MAERFYINLDEAMEASARFEKAYRVLAHRDEFSEEQRQEAVDWLNQQGRGYIDVEEICNTGLINEEDRRRLVLISMGLLHGMWLNSKIALPTAEEDRHSPLGTLTAASKN